MKGIKQVLIIGNAFVMGHVEAPVVTQDAGTDIFFPAFKQLCDPLRIRQELSGKSGAVDPSSRNSFCRCHRIHAAGTDHRDIHELPDVLYIFQVAVFGHIDRRMRPVPGIIGAVVAVEHIVSRILQVFCRELGLLHIAPGFLEFLARQCAAPEPLGLGHHAVAQ